MGLTTLLVLASVVLLIGFTIGARFEELNLKRRERRLAQARRELREEARAYDELSRALLWVHSPSRAEAALASPRPEASNELSSVTDSPESRSRAGV